MTAHNALDPEKGFWLGNDFRDRKSHENTWPVEFGIESSHATNDVTPKTANVAKQLAH